MEKPAASRWLREASALEVIREELGLTGTKLVCGSGACGACTVLVDGESKCACLLPRCANGRKEDPHRGRPCGS